MQFIESIYKILKPGGVWINLGPLLYHFSDMPLEDSIEPSYEVVRQVILGFGFQIEVIKYFDKYAEELRLFLITLKIEFFMKKYFFRKRKLELKHVTHRI